VTDLNTGGTATKLHAFTYVFDPIPIIESVEPDNGPPGILATITVHGFSEAVGVYFGVQSATVVDRPTPEQIVVNVPDPCTEPPPVFAEPAADGEPPLPWGSCEEGCWQCRPGDRFWRTVSVTVIDLETGAFAIAPHAFTCVSEPAVGLLAIPDTEIQPGDGTVDIPILLDYHAPAAGNVSAILFRLSYDSSILTITGVSVGEAAAAAGKSVSWSVDGHGLLSVAVADGIESIPQGELCVVHAEVRLDAGSGIFSVLRFEELSASLPDETEVSLEGWRGIVHVGMTYDVNYDGHVDAVDVQRVINMALGVVSGGAAEQMVADGDADGDIDAVDIQRAINRALEMNF